MFKNPEKISRVLLAVSIVLFILYFGVLSIARHVNLYSLRLDLGNMDQTVWNISRGRGFVMTDPTSGKEVSRLAYHADLLLYLFAPLYHVWSSPIVLLVVQVIVVGLGALPVFWIAHKQLKKPWVALFIAIAFLLYPPLERAVLYDFHPVTLATTFILFAYWCMRQKQWIWFCLFAILAGLTKEHVWISIACMGVCIALEKRTRLFGLVVTIISLSIFYILFWRIIPAYALHNQHFALSYLSDYGENINTVVVNIVKRPLNIVSMMLARDRLWYFFQLVSPLGFLPLFHPLALVFAGPDILFAIVSKNRLMRTIDYQYNSVIISCLFICVIEGYTVVSGVLKKMRLTRRASKIIIVWFMGSVITGSYVWGVLPHGLQSLSWLYMRKQVGMDQVKQVIASIPSESSVSVTNNIGSQVAERRVLYNFPVGARDADYVLVKLDDPSAWPSKYEQQKVVQELQVDPHYELIAHIASFSAFARKDL
jgi:uncharacterized membrane protein